jgi:2-haloacid dehalogenase
MGANKVNLDRREFLLLAAGNAVDCGSPMASAEAIAPSRFRAIAFDAFPVFDPRPIAALAESLFPDKGNAIMNVWRTRQFEYQWLRALSGRYADFLQATEESLLFTTKQLKLELSADQQKRLMSEWSHLTVWPDVPEAINTLRKTGLRLVVLSNMTAAVLADGLKRARLENMFEAVLSTDQIRSYKPDPRSYQLAMDELQLRREEILFVAFAGWDVAGAKWFGYPTYWVNRLDATPEVLGVEADAAGPDLNSLTRFILNKNGS